MGSGIMQVQLTCLKFCKILEAYQPGLEKTRFFLPRQSGFWFNTIKPDFKPKKPWFYSAR